MEVVHMKDVLKSFTMELGDLYMLTSIHILAKEKLPVDSWDSQEPYQYMGMPILDHKVNQGC
jgi:hypothetical protein